MNEHKITDDPALVQVNTCGAGDVAFLRVTVAHDDFGSTLVSVHLANGTRLVVPRSLLWASTADDGEPGDCSVCGRALVPVAGGYFACRDDSDEHEERRYEQEHTP